MSSQRNQFLRIEKLLNSLPVFNIFGAEVEINEPGKAHIFIRKIKEIHAGGFQSSAINGMVLMGLLDSAICSAALSHLDGDSCATVEISIKFVKPVIGSDIKAFGEVISRSKDIFFCKSSITDSNGRVRALATSIVKSIQKDSNEFIQNIN